MANNGFMVAYYCVLLAALCAALTNLVFRRCDEPGKKSGLPNVYLASYFFFSLFFACLLNPSIWSAHFNLLAFVIGCSVGLLNVILMLCTASALKRGPAGLTFAFFNASAIFPGFILSLLLGSNFGFDFSYFQALGMALVLSGLFLGAQSSGEKKSGHLLSWLKYAVACFLVQVIALTLIQGRCILFSCDSLGKLAFLSLQESDDVWFMPGQFGTAFLIQAWICFRHRKEGFSSREAIHGIFAGLTNFGSTLLLLLATKKALPSQKIILFPFFAAATIVLCNLWANRLYKEKFSLRTNTLCIFGILTSILR
jgi:hypothetical protein